MDDLQNQHQAQPETPVKDPNRYMTDAERRAWSGISEWHDPLEKPQPEPAANDGKLSMASLLCGIASILTSCTGIVNVVFGAAAIFCGIFAKKKQESARTLSTIGIILGICGIGVTLALLLFRIFLENGNGFAHQFTSISFFL